MSFSTKNFWFFSELLCSILSASFLIFYITFDEISLQFQSTNISLLYMYRVHLSLPELYRQCCADLNQYKTAWIVFLLLFKKRQNVVYTCFQNSMLLLINGFIFDLMNIQNNQSLEFEWVPMLAPFIGSVNDWRFPWICNVFVKLFQDWLNSVQYCQGNFTKDACQKMFISISSQEYEGWKTSVNY